MHSSMKRSSPTWKGDVDMFFGASEGRASRLDCETGFALSLKPRSRTTRWQTGRALFRVLSCDGEAIVKEGIANSIKVQLAHRNALANTTAWKDWFS